MRIHNRERALRVFIFLLGVASANAAIVNNPSFEYNYNDTWPHYGPIDGWVGGSGVNRADGPFHNSGTPVPDGYQMGFKQGSGDLSQAITGLVPGKRYIIQFFYDARGCCGGSIDLATKIDNQALDNIPNIKPVTGGSPYLMRTVPFTASAADATLTFTASAIGDATVLIDGVSIVQRDAGNLVLGNPSFEASGDVADTGHLINPLTGEPSNLAGWVATGQYGINVSGAGPYADNGAAPEQDHVLFLHGASSVSQTVKVVPNKAYQLSLAYNAKSGNSPHIQVKLGDAVLFEEDVAPVGGTAPYRTKTVSFTPTTDSAAITIAQTKEGDQFLLVDDVKLTGEVPPDVDPTTLAPEIAELGIGEQIDVSVKVSAAALASRDITIGLQSSANSVARFADASGALLPRITVPFARGGVNEKSVKLQGMARGTANIQIYEASDLPIRNQVTVTVVQAPVKNPSFESTPAPGGVGYGPIPGWSTSGGTGINKSDQPFANNGVIPDRGQVAFLQGAATLSQRLQGLTPGKNYWLQFFYNARDCCGANFSTTLSVSVGGKEVANIPNIGPVGAGNPYNFTSISFVADSANPLLEFKTTPVGDATLLLDGVNVVQRDPGQIIVRNPSFEASGAVFPFPGYFPSVAGWDVSGGGRGVNIDGQGPFTDNGRANAGDLVLFLQGNGASVSQNITGLTAGQKYVLAFLLNARNCCGPEESSFVATFNDVPLVEETFRPVGGAEPYMLKQVEFTADGAEGILKLQGATPEGDHTVLVDNVVILPQNLAPFIVSQPVSVSRAIGDAATFKVVAVGGGTLSYQWKKDGQPLTGQTSDTLALENLSLAMAGQYSVDVKNAGGTTSSDPARLAVLDRIPGVYDTGVGNNGVVLEDGAVDPHYILVQNIDDPASTSAYVHDSTRWPIAGGPWVANSDLSKWIGPRPEPDAATLDGDYVYRMSLDVTGFDPATVVLTGNIASDNSVEIIVNGNSTGVSQSGFGGLQSRTVSGVFKAGVNQVDFKVTNGAPPGPTGLRIEGLLALGVKAQAESPRLAIARSGQEIKISWPASATDFKLQTASSLPGAWADSTLPEATQGSDRVATAQLGPGGAFYRLIKR